jgi:hypothetical protein
VEYIRHTQEMLVRLKVDALVEDVEMSIGPIINGSHKIEELARATLFFAHFC